ncbi:MAG: hypothetical protein RMK57_08540 [Bryobacterales bacterium]|nr:hypothetical protein [Bryobacteraceae bacterium]MDW8354563.1 hypothetical protein [Bryobacterales bacterium]
MPRSIAALVLVAWRLSGAELCPALKEALAAYRAETDATRKARWLSSVTEVERFSRCYIEFLYAAVGFKDFVRNIEALRTDKQLGGGPSGGTDLVVRGAAVRTLSVAAEYGALARFASGQVVTFRGNLAGLPAVLLRKDVFPYCDPRTSGTEQPGFCVSSSLLGQLRRLSFGISFDTGRALSLAASAKGPEAAFPIHGGHSELSGLGLRYELWNRRDVSSPLYQQRWNQKLAAQTQVSDLARQLSVAFEPVFEKLVASPAYAAWQGETQERIRRSHTPEAALASQMSRLAALMLREHILTLEDIGELRRLYSRYGFEQDELMELAAVEPVIAVEYSYNRPLLQAPESALRFVVDVPLGRRWSLAVNSAGSFHHGGAARTDEALAGIRDLRFEFAAQVERVLGTSPSQGPATLSAAVCLQRQSGPAVVRAAGTGAVPIEARSIAAAQLKLTLRAAGGVRLPLAVSYSARTDWGPKPAWRIQLGFAYDFDPAFLP